MSLDFFAVASNLISLFVVIAFGFLSVKTKVLKPEASIHLSSLMMKITLPCTIFVSLVTRDYDPLFVHDGIVIFVVGVIAFVFMLYASRMLAVIFGVPKGHRGIWAFACAYSNSGFMGFPIALALFGTEGLALSVMLNISFNITIYTLGALEIIRDAPQKSSEGIDFKSIIFSNINIATVLSLLFYFGQIKLPPSVIMPMKYLSDATTPLSMIIIGMALAHSKASDIFTDIHAWTATAMRLIAWPLVMIGALKLVELNASPLVEAVLILINAMPGASVTAVLCEMYHSDVDFAARIIFIQNVISMITIPLVCMMI